MRGVAGAEKTCMMQVVSYFEQIVRRAVLSQKRTNLTGRSTRGNNMACMQRVLRHDFPAEETRGLRKLPSLKTRSLAK